MAELNTPLTLGDLHLKNRVIMAPLTRSRATADRVPTAMMAEYYAQRASAGLIISEATVISEEANGYLNTPGYLMKLKLKAGNRSLKLYMTKRA